MKLNVPLRRKDAEIEVTPCVVEKTVELSGALFDRFSENLLNDYDFILENIDCMYRDGDGVSHCLLVLGDGRDDGILVESEGSFYARYSAFVPHARQLWQQEHRYEPALQSYCDRMQTAMEGILHSTPVRQQDGMLRVPLSDFAPAPGEYPLDTALLYQMLTAQPEFDAVELFDDELVMQINPQYMEEQAQTEPVLSL